MEYSTEMSNSFWLVRKNDEFGKHFQSELVGDVSPSTLSGEFYDSPNSLYNQEVDFFADGLAGDFSEAKEYHDTFIGYALQPSMSLMENPANKLMPSQYNEHANDLLKQKTKAEFQMMLYHKMLNEEKKKKPKIQQTSRATNKKSFQRFPAQQDPVFSPPPPPGIIPPSSVAYDPSLLIVPPTAPAPTPSSQGVLGKVYQVQFKIGKRYFLRDPQVTADLGVTDYVVVEADRGTDMGVISGMLSTAEFMEFRARMKALDHSIYSPRRILRVASPVEQMNYLQKARDEEEAVEFANMLASTIHQLPLVVCDAEYQFDRNKLTVYYQSSGRVDFREMVRDMFAMFKVRIWMEKVEPTTTSGIYGF